MAADGRHHLLLLLDRRPMALVAGGCLPGRWCDLVPPPCISQGSRIPADSFVLLVPADPPLGFEPLCIEPATGLSATTQTCARQSLPTCQLFSNYHT